MSTENSTPAADMGTGTEPVLVVGIGASAGGLEALERLFEFMPTDTGMAFVVVQHLSPDFKSLTDDILARRTRLTIRVVEDGMPIQPNTIFLIPPRKDMILSRGRLLLSDKDRGQTLALPIDHFLRSLAQELGSRSVAVILSGTGTDGSRGVRDIHTSGGLVITQDPDTAKFDGMPRSALDTGVVDLSLAPEAIPAILVRHSLSPNTTRAPAAPPATGVEAVFRLLRDAYGIDFSFYKPETVSRRLERRLGLSDIPSVEEYAQRLAQDPAELNMLYKDLMIGVTRFFRDEEAFEYLGKEIIPDLLDKHTDDEFRVWVAGCATGEEAYTLAILIREALDNVARPITIKIFATDAHRASTDSAGQGFYPESALSRLAPERLNRFFLRVAGGYQVSTELRKMVVFAEHNVLKDPPFTRIDLISCRNLLIYFLSAAQRRVLSLFHFALKTGGVLFLGPSETTGEVSDEFEPLNPQWRVYRKRRDIRLANELRLPTQVPNRPAPSVAAQGEVLKSTIYDQLLDEFMPPSLLVTERGNLLQSFAGASKYLKFRDGRVSTELLDIVDAELRTALSGALPRVFNEHARVAYRGLKVSPPEGERLVDVLVRPILNRHAGVTHALVEVQEVGTPQVPRETPREINLQEASREQILTLESELRHTRENLQAMIEEMETSNEELQATNQELTAANEELQSTNEELHSVNEELYSVNSEFQKKIAELTQLSSDVDNLLASTEVHTIFLDRQLRLRKFTPKIAETFNLLPQDIGRRIDHFTYTIDHPGLMTDLEAVLDTPTPIERQVRDRRGNWFLLRVHPYRAGLAIDGVVLTLIDLSEVKRVEAEARRKDEELAGILRYSPNWIFIKNLSGEYIVADEAFRRAVDQDPIGKTSQDLFPPAVASRINEGDDRVIGQGLDDESEVVIPLADGPHTFLATKFPIRNENGRVVGVGGIKTDITVIRRAEQIAREAVTQRDRFLAMLSHELRNPLAAVQSAADVAARKESDSQYWLGVISRRVQHTSRLIDDLLDVARFHQKKIALRVRPMDLGQTMPGVVEEIHPAFADADLKLEIQYPTEPLPIQGDPDRLVQVQVNLLRNAVKYTPAGGQVWYSLGREGENALIRVRDTGVGLTEDARLHIFEPFFQADETLDRSSGGIGVGLTLVEAIVNEHGGTVVALSEGPGKGSEFEVRLPLRPNTVGTQSPCPIANDPAMAASTRALKILVVEDDPDIRSAMVGLLELDGHAIRAEGDGAAGLAAARTNTFDVGLLDIGLPGINGYELARGLRQLQPRMRLIALTGYGRQEDRARAYEAGFDAHLTKPFTPDALNRILASSGPEE